jgi:small-conductance mechanosensitive channel
MDKIKAILEFELFKLNDYSFTILQIVHVLIILIITKLLIWIISRTLNKKLSINNLDAGSVYALKKLLKYIIWTISLVFMLQSSGIEASVILAGSAALLVGVGLGLQQTFNDIVSGIILLYEKSVKVGDILEVDGEIVIIKEIGLRTSKGLTRNDITITLPNNIITTSKVINWTYQSKKTLFKVDIGVAYGSDIELVMELLNASAREHKDVMKAELIESRFANFGNSSLDFYVLFYSDNLFGIERVKSDIRRSINKKFTENNITIPFPQMDLHLK